MRAAAILERFLLIHGDLAGCDLVWHRRAPSADPLERFLLIRSDLAGCDLVWHRRAPSADPQDPPASPSLPHSSRQRQLATPESSPLERRPRSRRIGRRIASPRSRHERSGPHPSGEFSAGSLDSRRTLRTVVAWPSTRSFPWARSCRRRAPGTRRTASASRPSGRRRYGRPRSCCRWPCPFPIAPTACSTSERSPKSGGCGRRSVRATWRSRRLEARRLARRSRRRLDATRSTRSTRSPRRAPARRRAPAGPCREP